MIIATGSEVQLALAAQKMLAEQDVAVRVVSMPSTTTFDQQDGDYRHRCCRPKLPRIAVEMASTDGWWKYGCEGRGRHRQLRRIGPGAGALQAFRLHA